MIKNIFFVAGNFCYMVKNMLFNYQKFCRIQNHIIIKIISLVLLLYIQSSIYALDTQEESFEEEHLSAIALELNEESKLEGIENKNSKYPESYTLMLLDRSRIDWEKLAEIDLDYVWPFISPHVTGMEDRKKYFKHKSYDKPQKYYICKLSRERHNTYTENLIDALDPSFKTLPTLTSSFIPTSALPTSAITLPSLTTLSVNQEKHNLEFSAAMILFPLNDSNKVLAYLFGKWPALLNVDTIVKNFGLKVATSVGVFCSEEDRENNNLKIINTIDSEDYRIDDPMNAKLRSRRGLQEFKDFRLNAGESKIEIIRFKPIASWGRSYITASDSFQFRLNVPENISIMTLHEKALAVYDFFVKSADKLTYSAFLPYMDIGVDKDTAKLLTEQLIAKWPEYYKKTKASDTESNNDTFVGDIVYPHWTYWFRVQSALDKYAIYQFKGKNIKVDAEVIVQFPTKVVKFSLLSLIRSLPIKFKDKYYWFDRGDWFEISDTHIQAMKVELERDKVDYRGDLLLPSYDEERILAEKKGYLPSAVPNVKDENNEDVTEKDAVTEKDTVIEKDAVTEKDTVTEKDPITEQDSDREENEENTTIADYEELAYNKEVFQHIESYIKDDASATVVLMDRSNVILTGSKDKFEFADIVLKTKGHYYLIHVKRAKVNSLGHVCTQAERCGMYLSGHLDRSNLQLAFMMADLNSNSTTIKGPKSAFRLLVNKFPPLIENCDYKTFLKNSIFKKKKEWINPLIEFIDSVDFDDVFWVKYHAAFLKLLNYLSTLEDRDLTIKKIKEFCEIAKKGIEKSEFFTLGNILDTTSRHKITIVIAIIDDGETPFALTLANGEYKTNNIVRLHQTRKIILEKRLRFAWTVIPKKATIPAETLKEYSYLREDMDKLCRLQLKQLAASTLSPIQQVQTTKPKINTFEIKKYDLGTKNNPHPVTISKIKPNIWLLPTFSVSHDVRTEENYVAKILKELSLGKPRITLPFSLVLPYEVSSGSWITLQFNIMGSGVELLAHTSNIKSQDDKSKNNKSKSNNSIEKLNNTFKKFLNLKSFEDSKENLKFGTDNKFYYKNSFYYPFLRGSGPIALKNIFSLSDASAVTPLDLAVNHGATGVKPTETIIIHKTTVKSRAAALKTVDSPARHIGLAVKPIELAVKFVEMTDDQIYKIKLEHLNLLSTNQLNFLKEFEIPVDGVSTPRAKSLPPLAVVKKEPTTQSKEEKTKGPLGKDTKARETKDSINIDLIYSKATVLGQNGKIDFENSQKFLFTAPNIIAGIYAEYISCPTVGDGDCYFHAAFTKSGENKNIIKQKANEMRKDFCEAIKSGEYLDDARKLIYENYRELLSTYGFDVVKQQKEIPDNILKMFKENDDHQIARSYLISRGVDIDQLPPQLINEGKYSENEIRAVIPEDNIKVFMERYRKVAGHESYIPIRQNDMRCPAEILAIRNKVRLHIFVFRKDTGFLQLFKTVGDPTKAPISLLFENSHFMRLYNPIEDKAAAEQIIKNAKSK